MADLSYSDVQRAVQDGLRYMQTDIQRLQTQITTISQQTQLIDDTLLLVQQMCTQLNRIERLLQGRNPRTDIGTAQLTRDVQELKVRFVAVERFCQDMSKYIQQRQNQDLEDQQYRAA